MFRRTINWMMATVLLVSLGFTVYAKPAEKRVTISYWGVNITPEREQVIREDVIKPFEAKYPNIKVNFLGLPGNAKDYNQKLDMALAAGTPPDIGHIITESTYIAKGDLVPLDSYLKKSGLKGKYSKDVLNNLKNLDVKKHRLYGLPISGGPGWIVWARSDWFKEAGLKIPESWDEFFSSVKRLNDRTNGRYGLSIRGGNGSALFIEYLMYSYSGITEFFTKKGKCTVNDPKHVEFVEKYLSLYNVVTPEDDITKNWVELAATFQSGKAATIIHNLGSAASHEKAFGGDLSKFQAFFLKSQKGYLNLPAPNPSGLVMFKLSKNKDAAWKFMEFMASKEQASAWAKILGEIPVNQDCVHESWLQEKPYMKVGVAGFTGARTHFYAAPYYLPEYSTIRSGVVEPEIQAVMLKKLTAKEMLDDWAKRLEKAKADFDAAMKK
jgi:multiple sugar transport system substrate-binding protein